MIHTSVNANVEATLFFSVLEQKYSWSQIKNFYTCESFIFDDL